MSRCARMRRQHACRSPWASKHSAPAACLVPAGGARALPQGTNVGKSGQEKRPRTKAIVGAPVYCIGPSPETRRYLLCRWPSFVGFFFFGSSACTAPRRDVRTMRTDRGGKYISRRRNSATKTTLQ